jgi:hypothetical protein
MKPSPEDPYADLPEKDDPAAAKATDWFQDSLAQQRRKDAELRSNLGKDAGALKARNRRLVEGLMDMPPELDPEEPAPDLFATERAEARKKNSALSSIVDDLEDTRAAERALLKDLFGH